MDKSEVKGAKLAEHRADMMLELYTKAAKQIALRGELDNVVGKLGESDVTRINAENMQVGEESSQKDAEKSPENKKASQNERADLYEKANKNQDIISLVEKIENGIFDPTEKIDLGMVSDDTATKIEKLTGINVKGFKVAIEARQINHILVAHEKNGKTDRSMSDSADIAKMEYAMQNFDDISLGKSTQAYKNIENGKTRGAKTVLYEKSIGEKSYYVVQAVPDTKAKTLFVVATFIGEKGYKKGAPQFTNADSLGATSEIGTANASNRSIPQNSDLSTGNATSTSVTVNILQLLSEEILKGCSIWLRRRRAESLKW